jgi:hypothetical protein
MSPVQTSAGPDLRQRLRLRVTDAVGLEPRTQATVGAVGTPTAAEHDELLEGIDRGAEHAHAIEVRCDPAGELAVEAVGRQDQHEDAAVLQARIAALVEDLLQTLAAALRLAHALAIRDQIAVRRVEPQQAELAAAEHAVLEVAVDAVIEQRLGVPGPLLVVLDAVGRAALGIEMMLRFGKCDALAATGIEDAQLADRIRRERLQHALRSVGVAGEVAVLDEVAREALEHQGHVNLRMRKG